MSSSMTACGRKNREAAVYRGCGPCRRNQTERLKFTSHAFVDNVRYFGEEVCVRKGVKTQERL